jgi:hypothetical protein
MKKIKPIKGMRVIVPTGEHGIILVPEVDEFGEVCVLRDSGKKYYCFPEDLKEEKR